MAYPRRSILWAMVGQHVMLAIAVFVTSIPVSMGLQAWSEATALEQRGLEVEGRITELWTESGDDGVRYLGTYVFVAEGDEFTGQTKVDIEDWEKLEVGGKVLVRYVQGDPSVSASLLRRDIAERDGGRASLVLASLGFAAVGIFFIGAAGFEVRRVRRRFWLRDRGVVRLAKVLTRELDEGGWNITWRDDTGVEGKAVGIAERICPEVGATITVFAHPTAGWGTVWEGEVGSRRT